MSLPIYPGYLIKVAAAPADGGELIYLGSELSSAPIKVAVRSAVRALMPEDLVMAGYVALPSVAKTGLLAVAESLELTGANGEPLKVRVVWHRTWHRLLASDVQIGGMWHALQAPEILAAVSTHIALGLDDSDPSELPEPFEAAVELPGWAVEQVTRKAVLASIPLLLPEFDETGKELTKELHYLSTEQLEAVLTQVKRILATRQNKGGQTLLDELEESFRQYGL